MARHTSVDHKNNLDAGVSLNRSSGTSIVAQYEVVLERACENLRAWIGSTRECVLRETTDPEFPDKVKTFFPRPDRRNLDFLVKNVRALLEYLQKLKPQDPVRVSVIELILQVRHVLAIELHVTTGAGAFRANKIALGIAELENAEKKAAELFGTDNGVSSALRVWRESYRPSFAIDSDLPLPISYASQPVRKLKAGTPLS